MNLTDMPDVVIAANDVLNEIDTFFTSETSINFPLLSAKQFASTFFSNGHIDKTIVDELPYSQRIAFTDSISYVVKTSHYQATPKRNNDTNAIYNAIKFIRDCCVLLENQNKTSANPTKIFYSWQLSTHGKYNNYFIRDCLLSSVQEILSSSEIEEREQIPGIEIDSDTKGTSGAPHIFNTILSKIDSSTIFLADVSLISKKLCNSNVMVELGYAIKTLGFENVILVFNDSLGEIDDLPFDLRSQRITKYSFKEGDDKKVASKNLTSILKHAISAIVN